MSGNLKVKSLQRDLERARRKEKWREAGEIANQLGFLFRQIIIFLFLCKKYASFNFINWVTVNTKNANLIILVIISFLTPLYLLLLSLILIILKEQILSKISIFWKLNFAKIKYTFMSK